MSKTKAEIRADLDAIMVAHPQAIGAAGPPMNMDALVDGVHGLLAIGAVNPGLLAALKMAVGILPFLPLGPIGPVLAKLLEYLVQTLEALP